MNLSKKASTMTLAAIIGIILVVVVFFPIGQAAAKVFGMIKVKDTESSYEELVKNVIDIGQKSYGSAKTMDIVIDEGSAIMGFTSGSDDINIYRYGGMDFRFQKPYQCGTSACICFCKEFVQNPELEAYKHTNLEYWGVSGPYYCKLPDASEPEGKYLRCTTNLGTDIVILTDGEDFRGTNGVGDYNSGQYFTMTGGFIIGRLEWADNLAKSNVFNVPKKSAVKVKRDAYVSVEVNFV